MRKKIQLICPKCNTEYSKDLSEYNRNIKLNRISYCSIKCGANINQIPLEKRNYDISKHSNNRLSENTNFNYYLKLIKVRKQYIDITIEDLIKQWEKQSGICPYTKIKLQLCAHKSGNLFNKENPFSYASVDRIDSSKGYTKDNIEFVSIGINLMKNRFSKEITIDFINTIVSNYKEQDAVSGY